MEQAIKLATSVGYNSGLSFGVYLQEARDTHLLSAIREDPLFWQALGKAEGWVEKEERLDNFFNENMNWRYYWHRFIDHLAKGGTPDSFFEELLTK